MRLRFRYNDPPVAIGYWEICRFDNNEDDVVAVDSGGVGVATYCACLRQEECLKPFVSDRSNVGQRNIVVTHTSNACRIDVDVNNNRQEFEYSTHAR